MKKEEVIYLFEEDLNEHGKRESFEKVNYGSFTNESLPKHLYLKANLIIYVSYKYFPRYKMIKSKHF
jgi:hypothetical protein